MAEDAGEDLERGLEGLGGPVGGGAYHDDGDGEEDPVAVGCGVSCCV